MRATLEKEYRYSNTNRRMSPNHIFKRRILREQWRHAEKDRVLMRLVKAIKELKED